MKQAKKDPLLGNRFDDSERIRKLESDVKSLRKLINTLLERSEK